MFELEISAKERISPDSIWLTLKFPNPEWILGLPTAQHLIFYKPADAQGEDIYRKYTPVSPINQKGTADFVIKCYPQSQERPNGGAMGNYLQTKVVGDKILMSAHPIKTTYKGNCVFKLKRVGLVRITKIGLLTGGTGIAPHFSILDAIYRARENCIEVKMLYSNKTLDDILLRIELDAINTDASAPNISVTHTLTRVQGDLPAPLLKSRINIEKLQQLGFPEPSPETLYMVCGPKDFNKACRAMLRKAGHSEDRIF